ncbi:MSCRAMM family protein [Aeromicrobium duanguangcaii]|uniref:Carboxypeptidase-like regulatory domain-containing protein n=1 Tax=Aeromicrobium duanguangcaii TaxID=2968086 RepID=A0ABY5KIL5_9ACTN|nr:carboxypeptidase-like regulatory domain-containing protein [Aeromicrobium duanguangcaii]MCD9153210.1 carboxypeptidase-like regulatory domain-containing protein [Aeromicrobium duanguangcaii]MCL3836797.1 carboxypeptidase-like regulatory domain-containing protein [Aeromicrobium duanguangcaii]UUI69690.1 carboxypeptidase-like regulatory domain-containing protein [Aeromicrobium duanguangcaii]
MPFRLPSLAAAFVALVGSLIVSIAPAQAAGGLSTKTSVVAMNGSGYGSVWARCTKKKACKGNVYVEGAASQKRSFTVKARSARWVTFRNTNWKTRPSGVLRMSGASPKRIQQEARVAYGTISGTVSRASGAGASGVKVELWRIGSRNRNVLISTATDVERNGGRFSFRVAMGANNGPSATYKLHVVGTSGGERRSWWWRGNGTGGFAGGARDMSAGTSIKVTRGQKYRYVANARYASIKGQVRNGSKPVAGTEVTIVGRPPYWSSSSRVLRDLDFMACANVYGRTTTNGNGNYEVGFLPTSSARIYAVKPAGSLWFGSGDKSWGTCHAVVNNRAEKSSTSRMLPLPAAGLANRVQNVGRGRTKVTVAVGGYQGPSSTAKVDRYLTVREYAKGRTILSSDVVRAGSGRQVSLGEGHYWFEIGRRTGCSAWYKSRYKNNDGYFNGLDRGFEKWKAKNHKMYRQHCRAYTAGTYKLVHVKGSSMRVVLKNAKGGSVSGRVTAKKVKPRTELMVRLTSTDGKKVYRTAMTDGAGKFKVTGLASGKYRIVVNADSWRGISRAFSGPKTVTVKRGKNKSVGTLNFRQ